MIDQLPPTLTRVDPATKRRAEYIRADVAEAQRAELNARIAELEAWQETAQRMEAANELQRQVIAMHKQHIAELSAELAFMRDDRNLYYATAKQQTGAIEELDARIAELEEAQQWVSVDERLPKLNERVWVIGTNATYPQTAHYRYNTPSGAYWDVGDDLPLRHVTHWMPLPPPP